MTPLLEPAPRNPIDLDCTHDPLAVLSAHHENARMLAEACRRAARRLCGERDIRGVAERLCGAIRQLAALEEEVLYPAARIALCQRFGSVVDLAVLENATARQIIRQMEALDPCEARYEALVVALTDCVDRQARLVQGELFTQVRHSQLDLAELGARLTRRADALETAH